MNDVTKDDKTDSNKDGKTPDSIWQKFMERDAHLDKLQEDRANFWIAVVESKDAEKEKEALVRIEKVLNPEIDAVATEVRELLAEYHAAGGKDPVEIVEDDGLDGELDEEVEDVDDEA